MAMMERPGVITFDDGSKYWENEFEKFYLKAYVPSNDLDGKINNYTFKAPLLLVFEESNQSMGDAIDFAKTSGLDKIAAASDASVLFVYPTCEGGWKNATVELYQDLIAEIKMDPNYEDGMIEDVNYFTREFRGYYIRGAKFRTDIYSFGESADYVAKNLLKSIDGEFLWGPGNITPAMCSMENLSVKPVIERNDIGILSVGNSDEINEAFAGCKNLLIKKQADYQKDFTKFVRKFKVWCGNMEYEPDLEAMHMAEEAGSVMVQTSEDNFGPFKGTKEHKVGYFAYYNKDLFDHGPAPLVVAFHGFGDSTMFLTYVSGWYEVAQRYNFLYVAIENHMDVPASEVMQVLEHIKQKYEVDTHRIYAAGFSMGCAKTWDLFQEYPETFAGLAPASALLPVYSNPFGRPVKENINKTVPVPVFYSGGECSHLCELPMQGADGLERLKYAAEVNKCINKFDYTFDNKEAWADPVFAAKGDRVEVLHDDTRDADLTIHYFDSEDGVCRTAYAWVSGQGHEFRHHTVEQAWKFISKFRR